MRWRACAVPLRGVCQPHFGGIRDDEPNEVCQGAGSIGECVRGRQAAMGLTLVPGQAEPWDLGFSGGGVAVARPVGGVVRLAVFGPVAGARTLHPELASLAEAHLLRGLNRPEPLRLCCEELVGIIHSVDVSIRGELESEGLGTRGTLVCASFRDGRLYTADTGAGSALVLRGGEVLPILGEPGGALPQLREPDGGEVERAGSTTTLPWIGARRKEEAAGCEVFTRRGGCPVKLERGDRLVFCSSPLAELEASGAVRAVLGEGVSEVASQALSDVLRVYRGLDDVAVAVLDWGVEHSEAGADAPESVFDDALLADLTHLVVEITDELDLDAPDPETPPLTLHGSGGPEASSRRSPVGDANAFWNNDDDIFEAMAALQQVGPESDPGVAASAPESEPLKPAGVLGAIAPDATPGAPEPRGAAEEPEPTPSPEDVPTEESEPPAQPAGVLFPEHSAPLGEVDEGEEVTVSDRERTGDTLSDGVVLATPAPTSRLDSPRPLAAGGGAGAASSPYSETTLVPEEDHVAALDAPRPPAPPPAPRAGLALRLAVGAVILLLFFAMLLGVGLAL